NLSPTLSHFAGSVINMADTQGHLPGDVEAAARAAVASMGVLAGIQEPLAESAYSLARTLDLGVTGVAVAPIARELRETLVALKEAADAGDAASTLEDFLSSAVGNPAD
ncbi:MAG: hypothetical protein ACRDPR_06335, partial [Nocardioidaceae bacterium]